MKRKRKVRGQAIVELAILFPFLLLIVVGGIIDFGFAFYNLITLQEIANDAAIYAAENKAGGESSNTVETFVLEKKPAWWSGNMTVSVTTPTVAPGVSSKKVVISYDSPVYTPFWQTTVQAFSGNESMRLAVMAVYQIPNCVAKR
ncbi:MAG: pilus assembly protein [Candidatus Riflebacteria bacterium]|nr:pilus assembly protein [Candidatus Riflebacteria bacterium]